MELSWVDTAALDGDGADRWKVDGIAAVGEAARVLDCPHQRVQPVSSLVARMRHGWDGDPPLTAVMCAGRSVVGYLEVDLPKRDNTHLGFLDVTVDPLVRRRGIGRALFEAGVERVRAEGRRSLLAECWDSLGAVGFLEAMGMSRASAEVQRRQDISDLDWSRLDHEEATARKAADGYELMRLAGPTPEELLDQVVAMTAAINDAPTDDLDVEDEVFSGERIRAFEAAQVANRRRIYRLVAREQESGDLAGHTVLGVDADQPWLGMQFDTSVLRAHRGHRLGLLLKISMLRWLLEEEPQLRTVDTWNAASNAHMIDVNETLGYRVVATATAWQRAVDPA